MCPIYATHHVHYIQDDKLIVSRQQSTYISAPHVSMIHIQLYVFLCIEILNYVSFSFFAYTVKGSI